MRKSILYLVAALAITLAGCGSEAEKITIGEEKLTEPEPDPAGGKSLFSQWISEDGKDALYFDTMEFDVWQHIAIIDGDDICVCDLLIEGRHAMGNYTFSGCISEQGDQAICNVLDRTGSYTKTADTLTMMPASSAPQAYH